MKQQDDMSQSCAGLTAAVIDETLGGLIYMLKRDGSLPPGPAFTVHLEVDYKAVSRSVRDYSHLYEDSVLSEGNLGQVPLDPWTSAPYSGCRENANEQLYVTEALFNVLPVLPGQVSQQPVPRGVLHAPSNNLVQICPVKAWPFTSQQNQSLYLHTSHGPSLGHVKRFQNRLLFDSRTTQLDHDKKT